MALSRRTSAVRPPWRRPGPAPSPSPARTPPLVARPSTGGCSLWGVRGPSAPPARSASAVERSSIRRATPPTIRHGSPRLPIRPTASTPMAKTSPTTGRWSVPAARCGRWGRGRSRSRAAIPTPAARSSPAACSPPVPTTSYPTPDRSRSMAARSPSVPTPTPSARSRS